MSKISLPKRDPPKINQGEENVTIIERMGPIPLGPLKLEIIAINCLVRIPKEVTLYSQMSNPKHVAVMGRNSQASNAASSVEITGKVIKFRPRLMGGALVWVLGK